MGHDPVSDEEDAQGTQGCGHHLAVRPEQNHQWFSGQTDQDMGLHLWTSEWSCGHQGIGAGVYSWYSSGLTTF